MCPHFIFSQPTLENKSGNAKMIMRQRQAEDKCCIRTPLAVAVLKKETSHEKLSNLFTRLH